MKSQSNQTAGKKTQVRPEQYPGLLSLLPMLYVAWADGILSPSEAQSIRQRIREQPWLTDGEKNTLDCWLDPQTPPDTRQLQSWLRLIRCASEDVPDSSRLSLARLGVEIARIGASDGAQRCVTPEACLALEEIEEALGIIGSDATAELLNPPRPEKSENDKFPRSRFSIQKMQILLDGEHRKLRRKVRRLLSDPVFAHIYGRSKKDHREQVLRLAKILAAQGLGKLAYPQEYGGRDQATASIAVFETLAVHDLSLTVKFGVQFGLFGGSILQLGTKQHHEKYLKRIGALELPGCFAMTEYGHGSNVRDIETTAIYDPHIRQFEINTPRDSARKEYIGNAAAHGRLATVFAQLIIGKENYGVHAFLVPLRDENGKICNGVRIEDNGYKMGLNGVDNGRIWFDHVRIPRENLLNRFAEVSEDGIYTSPIAGENRRFFTMLGTLVAGRISVAAGTLSAAKAALTIAVNYAYSRRQFGPAGEAETRLIDYPSHQRRLMPLLANAYALDFALKYLVSRYEKQGAQNGREVETFAAALKAWSTWNTTETIQECRESCGGNGYLSINRFADLKADSEIFTTFEGDNTVLMQLVARGLLTDYKQQFNEMNLFGLLKYAAGEAARNLVELNPLGGRNTAAGHLQDAVFHQEALRYREQRLLNSVAKRLKKRIDGGENPYRAFLACQTHLIKLAAAHAERLIYEHFSEAVVRIRNIRMKKVLLKLASLFALSRIETDRGWFLESGYFEGVKSRAIRGMVDQLSTDLAGDAHALVQAFGIPDSSLAPIARSEGENRVAA